MAKPTLPALPSTFSSEFQQILDVCLGREIERVSRIVDQNQSMVRHQPCEHCGEHCGTHYKSGYTDVADGDIRWVDEWLCNACDPDTRSAQ